MAKGKCIYYHCNECIMDQRCKYFDELSGCIHGGRISHKRTTEDIQRISWRLPQRPGVNVSFIY